jgi:hypothetical protein
MQHALCLETMAECDAHHLREWNLHRRERDAFYFSSARESGVRPSVKNFNQLHAGVYGRQCARVNPLLSSNNVCAFCMYRRLFASTKGARRGFVNRESARLMWSGEFQFNYTAGGGDRRDLCASIIKVGEIALGSASDGEQSNMRARQLISGL